MAAGEAAPVAADPFLQRFFGRISPETAASFDERQLAAIKMAFGARSFGSHVVDLRTSMPMPGGRWYLVLLCGRERRSPDRLQAERMPVLTAGNALFLGAVLGASIIAAMLLMYGLKSALGIDVLPDTSLGLWAPLQEQIKALLR